MKAVLEFIFNWMPIIFGIGFVAPVVAAFLNAGGFTEVFGLPALYWGLGIGLVWGSVARFTGRWI